MKQLLDRRFKNDNRDINDKTSKGQAKTQKEKAVRDADERYREPELHSIYDLPTESSLSLKPYTKR